MHHPEAAALPTPIPRDAAAAWVPKVDVASINMNHRLSPFLRLALLTLMALAFSACRSPVEPASEPSGTSLTLLEQKLFEILKREQQLDLAAAVPDVQYSEIQRLFMQVARDYNALIARNPDHLETRLLYGKLLSRYGDSEGARDQFLLAARIDPEIAVIHQQLCTYYAEENDFTRALAYALNAVRIEPQTAAFHFQLGQVLAAFREKFLEEEIFSAEQLDSDLLAAFETAKSLQPDALPLQFRFGEAFYDVENPDWDRALAHWQALSSNPSLSPLQADAAFLHQAKCLLELQRKEDAQHLIDSIQNEAFKNSLLLLLQD